MPPASPPPNEEQLDPLSGIRDVSLNDTPANIARSFLSNQLRTAKYTPLNLIPKALFEQFRRVSNFYFLIIAIISFIGDLSPSTPLASVLPLLVVVGFGFARDVYEDLKRAREDHRQNALPQLILARRPQNPDNVDKSVSLLSGPVVDNIAKLGLQPDLHRMVTSRNVAVGDFVFVKKGQVFPCDMVLLHSAAEGGVAYVSTANLDGESNLKRVLVAAPTADLTDAAPLLTIHGTIRAQKPTTALHEFEATLMMSGHQPTPLGPSNLLLRGSILRNTEYVYGIAMYTGFDTKVALNMRNPPNKMGSVERKLNWIVLLLFAFLAVIVIGGSAAAAVLQRNRGAGQWYMGEFRNASFGSTFANSLGTFLILFSTFIPVSLFVTLEFIRVIQGLFISADYRMKTNGQSVIARSTNLNEMLGGVEHILSDKTGTLTENIMRYIACSADGSIYNILKQKRVMEKAVKADVKPVKDLILAMALCHSVVPATKSDEDAPLQADEKESKKKIKLHLFKKSEKAETRKDSNLQDGDSSGDNDSTEEEALYQGQSPDEVALVTSASEYGIPLLKRTLDTLVIDHFGTTEEYTALAELEFNSDRKRMSMIFKCPDGTIRMFTKGADTIMLPLLKSDTVLAPIQNHIDEFAKEGLRTLVFASKQLSPERFDSWFSRFQEAKNSLENRDSKVSVVSTEIETDLNFIATTAVEDKLQDKVPETIKFMREAGVKLWVLTGDKRETAENIGYSANLLDRGMDVVHVKGTSSGEIENQLRSTLDRHIVDEGMLRRGSSSVRDVVRRLSNRGREKIAEKELGIVIDGKSLSFAIEDHAQLFMELSDHAKVVICCRVTPLQKALVVRLVREERKSMTLAIGDGGNDVSMIQEAHIGVGIFGKEGTQAARAADYAMGEFKHLLRLTALHGRFSIVRSAGMINLSFYKNIFFTMTLVLFQPFCFASGVTFNNQWVASAFNVVVTSAPPLLFGIFERDVDESTAIRFPSVYASNRERKLFSVRSVLEYTMVYGLWHSVVVFFGVFVLFGYLRIGFQDGKDSGLFLVGFANSTLVTLMALFKMLLHSHTLNWIVLAALVLSFGVYIAVVPLSIAVVNEYPLEGQLRMLFSSPTFYLAAFVIMVTGFVLDFFVLSTRQLLRPNVVDRLRTWEREVAKPKM